MRGVAIRQRHALQRRRRVRQIRGALALEVRDQAQSARVWNRQGGLVELLVPQARHPPHRVDNPRCVQRARQRQPPPRRVRKARDQAGRIRHSRLRHRRDHARRPKAQHRRARTQIHAEGRRRVITSARPQGDLAPASRLVPVSHDLVRFRDPRQHNALGTLLVTAQRLGENVTPIRRPRPIHVPRPRGVRPIRRQPLQAQALETARDPPCQIVVRQAHRSHTLGRLRLVIRQPPQLRDR